MLRMKKPVHPGRILKDEFLDPLELTVTEAARRLGVTRQNLSEIINGKRSISTEMAFRLSKALGTSVELWLNLQMQLDIVEVEQTIKLDDIKLINNRIA